ncbi:MAG: tetratricopeptide repeat protein [Rhodospirillales bacterium]|nr:tetratricopeptide repeat protein [Rhodospirillales bacterium]
MNAGFSRSPFSFGVLRRYVIIALVALMGWGLYKTIINPLFVTAPTGDFEVRQGDILLSDKKYDEALERFDAALMISPDHRGALMGRALVFLQTGQDAEAEAALTGLIDGLSTTLEPDDATGRGALAAAYANRGILYDRMGEFEKALANYILALRVDAEAVSGPDIFDKILYEARPSSIEARAKYLDEQLQLPEDQRILRVPEIDARQRMHKP